MPTEVNLMKLSAITPGHKFHFDDYNMKYCYTRLLTPDNKDSGAVMLQFQYGDSEDWYTNKGLLSAGFIAVKTSEVVNHIIESLQGNPTWQGRNLSGTIIKSSFLLDRYQIENVSTVQSDRFLYKLLTGIDCDIQQCFNTTLSFNVVNGYAGNSALRLMFGIHKKFNDQKEINNIFILADYNIRLIHDSHLNVSISDVTDVMNVISTRVQEYKNIVPTQAEHEAYAKILGAKQGKAYLARVAEIPENYSNLYYTTFLLTSMIERRNMMVEQALVTCMQKHHPRRRTTN